MTEEHSSSASTPESASAGSGDAPRKKLGPLNRDQRRVLGVLVEKAKTTPDNYPMTISALVSGANQKSNRSPQMQMDEDDVQIALDGLRALGAALEVQGAGRVNKYRHAAYEWMGVNGREAAVMTELLLRGPQTAGELRGRASRMEPLPDLATANEVINSLIEKGLVVALGRPGRGQQFAHTLYEPDEQNRIGAAVSTPAEPPSEAPAGQRVAASQFEQLQQQIDDLQRRVEQLEANQKPAE